MVPLFSFYKNGFGMDEPSKFGMLINQNKKRNWEKDS